MTTRPLWPAAQSVDQLIDAEANEERPGDQSGHGRGAPVLGKVRNPTVRYPPRRDAKTHGAQAEDKQENHDQTTVPTSARLIAHRRRVQRMRAALITQRNDLSCRDPRVMPRMGLLV